MNALTAHNPYTDGNSFKFDVGGSRGICDVGSTPFTLIDGERKWRVEWHHYFGPQLLRFEDDEPAKRVPGVKSRFWAVAQFWFDQGGKVVDGVGVWVDPPTELRHYRKIGKNSYQHVDDDATGDDIFSVIEYVDDKYNWFGFANRGAS